ncbi:MG2 domain protein [Vibrio mangrovi]|nr:MG2 domain protein [Vibrio mangrovi]
MRKRYGAWYVVLIVFLSLGFYPDSAVSGVNTAQPKVTFIGAYSHAGKPALIIQFDSPVRTRKVAQVFALTRAEGDSTAKKDLATLLKGTWQLNAARTAVIYDQVKVNQRYRVTLLPEIASEVGQSQEVTIYERMPQVRLIGKGPVVPSYGERTIPLSIVNAGQLTVEVLQVDEPATLLNRLYYDEDASPWALGRLRKSYRAVTTLSFDVPKAAVNQDVRTAIRLPKSLAQGWYVLLIKVTGDYDSSRSVIAHVLLTDIGIQAKVFRHQLDVLVSSLSGRVNTFDRARVFIYRNNQTIPLGKISGLQQSFDYQVQEGDVLAVRYGKQMSVLPLKEVPLDLSDFQVSGREWQPVEAFVYSNRDLFKPGETLPLNIVLRDQDGRMTEKQRLYVEYRKPDGNVVGYRWLDAEKQVPGFYQDQFSIPASAPLGRWTVYVKSHQDAERPLNQFSFNVSEFVPERMDMNIDIARGLQTGVESLPVRLEGKYLFGAPAAGNQVKVSAFYQPTHHFEGELSEFYVGQPFTIRSWKDVPDVQPFALNEQGTYELKLPLVQQQLLKSPVVARFNFALLETGGASIQRNKQVMLWTGNALAGIRPLTEEVDSYSTARFEVGLLNGQGNQLESGRVQYLLERNRGGYYWVYTESDGWDLRHDNQWQPVQSDVIQTTVGQAVPLNVDVEWGSYRLTLLTPQKQVTQYQFWAGWGDSSGQKPVKPDQLTMSLNKERYLDDDEVVATISTGVAGRLHLALESDRVEWHIEHQIIAGQHQIIVPLNKLKRHDLYLTATLISTEQGKPRRLFAIEPVKFERESRQLDVQIRHAKKLLPLEQAEIVVQLKKPVTQPTWVTLSLVDQGIINLSRYQVPGMFAWFFDQRRYSGDVIDLYSRIYQQRPDSFLKHRYGGDMALSTNAHLDETVESKTITIMSGPVRLNAQGKATIHVDIPDYNGQAQVVAMVFNQDQYGQAVSRVDIAAPIVAELAVPRFLTPGDSSQTLLEVFNQTDVVQQVTATVTASNHLLLQGKSHFSFNLKPGERDTGAVSFDIADIRSRLESATLNIDIRASGSDRTRYEQHRSWTVPVRLTEPVIHQKSIVTLPGNTGKTEAYMPSVTLLSRFWQDIRTSSWGAAEITYSRTPQIGVLEYAGGLFGYPYGCAEQTTSKAAPWLLDDPALTSLKQSAAEEKSETDILKAAVLRLATMQKGNGSFALWNKYGTEEPWVSVYVTEFLWNTAQRYPGLVPQDMLEKALTHMSQYPQKKKLSATRYYAAWVGSKANRVDYTSVWALKQTTPPEKMTSPLSAAYLGGALLLHGAQRDGEAYFRQIESIQRHSDSEDYDYGSSLRDYAGTIVVLTTLDKVIKLSDDMLSLRNRLAEEVVHMARQRRYLSTQEQIALVKAGVALHQINQEPVDLVVGHGDQQRKLSATGIGYASVVPGDKLFNPNDHELFVQVMASGLAEPDTIQSTLPYKVATREYRYPDGQPYQGDPLDIGDKLLVTVSYSADEPVTHAMLVEYLPTGFVLEHPDRTNSQDLIRAAKLPDSSDRTETIEYRNDRLMAALQLEPDQSYSLSYVIRAETPGQSVVPYLYLEDMYHPESFIYAPASLKKFTIREAK